jgi:hypothetical protein
MKKIDKFVRPKFNLFTDELGIRELALIMDGWDSEKEQPVIFALPWKNKTEADLKKFLDLIEPLGFQIMDFWVEGDFLIFIANGDEDNKKYIKNLVPSKNSKIYEALKEAGDGEIKIAFVVNDQIRNGFQEFGNDLILVFFPILDYLSAEQPFKNMILFTANKVEWISSAITFGQYIGDSKKFSCKTVIKTHRKNDAVFLRNLIDGCIDYGILHVKTSIAIVALNEGAEITEEYGTFLSLASEFVGGFMRKFLPEVKEDRLVLSFETDKFTCPIMNILFLAWYWEF